MHSGVSVGNEPAQVGHFGASVLVIGLIAAGWFVVGQSGRDKARAAAAAPTPAIPVTIGVAETRDVPVIVRGIGTVQSYKSVAVKTRVDGPIVKVAFEEGQEVKAGDLLFEIDPRSFQAAFDQRPPPSGADEARLTGARLDLERFGS
jgi:multidrug efflux system membrane fusion protein